MFGDITVKVIENERLLFTILPFMPVLLIFINSNTLRSFLIGLVALIIYLLVNGEILGRAFFGDEDSFFKLIFGLFTFIALMALTGILAIVALQHEIWYMLGMVFAAAVSSFLNLTLVRYDTSSKKVSKGKKTFPNDPFLITVYVSYAVSFLLSFWILFNERSGWVLAKPSVWAVIPPTFLRFYFISTALLVGIAVLPGKRNVKLLLIALHSAFSLLFIPILLYPGVISLEGWYDLGRARVVLDFTRLFLGSSSLGIMGFLRALNSFSKGLSVHLLAVTFAGALNVDMYWSGVLLVPILWGFLVPVTSYKLTQMVGGDKRASILAAFLTLPNFHFLAWGKLSISDSLGILFSILLLYLLLRFLSLRKRSIFLPIFITLVVVTATHFLPAVMSVSFALLVFVLKKYERLRLKYSRASQFLLFSFFVLSVFLLPLSVIFRGVIIPAIGTSAFRFDKIPGTSMWALVFGVSEEVSVAQAMLNDMIFPILGLIGLVYTLQRQAKFKKTLCLFFFLAFGVSIIDHRILEYAFEGGLFGAGRLNVFRDILALPFVAIVIESVVKSLFSTAKKARSIFTWRNLLVVALVGIGFSSWVTLMVHRNYEFYTWGLLPTSLELEAIKYIDEYTNGKYVVFAPTDTAAIAEGFLGYPYPLGKLYVEFPMYVRKPPSIGDMFGQMEGAEADVGYLLAPSFRIPEASFEAFINEASRIFGLFKVLSNENGDIYIFEYKIPPLPSTSNVMAFYWDTPPTYYIQNDLMRIIVNPATKTLDVQDFWGDLYESIELNQTIVGGNSIGNFTSIEYFDVTNNKWAEWSPNLEIPIAEQFQFRLRFENESLIGVVERGIGLVQLQWESGKAATLSLDVGDFTRLYIPGLISAKDSYDVISREYGLLYTRSLTNNVVLQPAYTPNVNGSSLTYTQIVRGGNFTLTEGYMWYDLYVHSTADIDQWTYIEVWLPDEVYAGTFPPLSYSLDEGETWVYTPYDVDAEGSVPIRTIGGTEVNWIFSVPRFIKEKPTEFWSHYSPDAIGDVPKLPENYTDSGGAQNRIFFGFYLPARDKVLVRLGVSVYEPRPFEVSYNFTDSDNIAYGLHNMKASFIKFYNLGSSEYVGGISLTSAPTSMLVTQDENAIITSIVVTIPSNTFFILLAAKGLDTTVDADGNGIPDAIER